MNELSSAMEASNKEGHKDYYFQTIANFLKSPFKNELMEIKSNKRGDIKQDEKKSKSLDELFNP